MIRRTGLDPTSVHNTLSGELLLIGAVLRQAIDDARREFPDLNHEQAIAFLRDQEAMNWWAELVGADGDVLGEAMRRAAGMEER